MQNFFSQSFLVSVLSLFLFTQCAKSDSGSTTPSSNTPSPNTPTLKSTPTANALYDTSAQGIYTGTITGSTGSWSINYDNSGTGAAPVLEFSYTPTGGSAITGTITGTKGIVVNAHTLSFSGTVGGLPFLASIVIDNTSGAISSPSLSVNGNAISLTAFKEKSTYLVTAYEGTSSGSIVSSVFGVSVPVTGVFNLAATSTNVQGVSRTLTVNGTACSVAACFGAINTVALAGGTNIASGSSIPTTCPWTPTSGTCNCQTNFVSSQGVTPSTTSISGTWTATIAATSSSCVGPGAPSPSTPLANGFQYASGTWSGTRTR